MSGRNPIERRALLLEERAKSFVTMLTRALTEPTPPFQEKVSEQDQVRTYIKRMQAGEIPLLRESNGGSFSDEDVDRYVGRMERLMSKYAPQLLLQKYESVLAGGRNGIFANVDQVDDEDTVTGTEQIFGGGGG